MKNSTPISRVHQPATAAALTLFSKESPIRTSLQIASIKYESGVPSEKSELPAAWDGHLWIRVGSPSSHSRYNKRLLNKSRGIRVLCLAALNRKSSETEKILKNLVTYDAVFG
jgi:hypothetical protein